MALRLPHYFNREEAPVRLPKLHPLAQVRQQQPPAGQGRGQADTAVDAGAEGVWTGLRPYAMLATGRGVAQLGSAPAWGAGGRWFESSLPDQISR